MSLFDNESLKDDRYKLIEEINPGSKKTVNSRVYKALDKESEEFVAIKTLKKWQLEADKRQKWCGILAREAAILDDLSQLNHPSLLSIRDVFISESMAPCIVTDYWKAESLSDFLQSEVLKSKSDNISLEEFWPEYEERLIGCMAQLADALLEMHQLGWLHLDVAPNNILLSSFNSSESIEAGAVLIDFSSAEWYKSSSSGEIPSTFEPGFIHEKYGIERNDSTLLSLPDPRIDAYGSFFSETYSSPQRLKSESKSILDDVYSLSATYYFLLTDKAPVPTASRRKGQPLEPPNLVRPCVSEHVSDLVLRGMELSEASRIQSIDAYLWNLRPRKYWKTSLKVTSKRYFEKLADADALKEMPHDIERQIARSFFVYLLLGFVSTPLLIYIGVSGHILLLFTYISSVFILTTILLVYRRGNISTDPEEGLEMPLPQPLFGYDVVNSANIPQKNVAARRRQTTYFTIRIVCLISFLITGLLELFDGIGGFLHFLFFGTLHLVLFWNPRFLSNYDTYERMISLNTDVVFFASILVFSFSLFSSLVDKCLYSDKGVIAEMKAEFPEISTDDFSISFSTSLEPVWLSKLLRNSIIGSIAGTGLWICLSVANKLVV